MELEPVELPMSVNPYHRAVELSKRTDDVDMPIAFNHPTQIRAAGSIRKMVGIGLDSRGIPDYDITVQSRRGATMQIKLLEAHGQIHHSFSEADEDVAKYKQMRGHTS